MLGHAWAAMTLNVYAGLFADDFVGVADQLDCAYTKFECDQMLTTRLPSQSNQGVLPFENSPEQATGVGQRLRAAVRLRLILDRSGSVEPPRVQWRAGSLGSGSCRVLI